MAASHENSEGLIPIVMPDLGTAGATPRISAWFVEPGDSVEPGEPILEVTIPGVACDVPARVPGTIARLTRPLDAIVASGDIVAWLAPK